MSIESGLYHGSHYDRSRPVGSYWEATGGPEPEGVGPLQGGPRRRRRHRRRWLYRPLRRLSPGARARHPRRRARGRADRLGCLGPQWRLLRPRRQQARLRRHGPALGRAGGGAVLRGPEGRAWRWCGASPRTKAIDIEIAGEGEHYLAHRTSRWHELENAAATVQRLFGERWQLWRKAEMEERLLRSPGGAWLPGGAALFRPAPAALRPRPRPRGGRSWGARPRPHAGDQLAARPAASTGWPRRAAR